MQYTNDKVDDNDGDGGNLQTGFGKAAISNRFPNINILFLLLKVRKFTTEIRHIFSSNIGQLVHAMEVATI